MDADLWPSALEEQTGSAPARPPTYRTYRPPPPLAALVESFWYYDGYHLPHAQERILPHGALELIITLRSDTVRVVDRHYHTHPRGVRGPLICGAYTEPFLIDTACQASTLGVHFKPGGAAPFLKMPAADLRDAHVPLDLLWGAQAADLRDRLRDASAPEAMFRILEQALVAHLARPLARHPAVAFALREFHRSAFTRPISAVTADTGLSARRFIHLFAADVGLTPKLYCRIRRFQRLLRRLDGGQPVAWADVALACGYCDQAHLAHDFQAFSGLTPTAYLARRGTQRNHVPLSP